MPDKRAHRGAHPEDRRLFAAEARDRLAEAVADLSWLLGRGYAERSATTLVGDRFSLALRRRLAVLRCACSASGERERRCRRLDPGVLAGQVLYIDGFNLLTTLESALAGGLVLGGRDGCYRDLASVHGTYRKVAETLPALEILGSMLDRWQVARCTWYLDRPVSNSGRMKTLLLALARRHGWDWQVELVNSPDRMLADAPGPIATADSAVLDRCRHWVNLARHTVDAAVPGAWIVDLAAPAHDAPVPFVSGGTREQSHRNQQEVVAGKLTPTGVTAGPVREPDREQ